MGAAKGSQAMFHARQAPGAVDAGGIGRPAVTPRACLRQDEPAAEKRRETDPPASSGGP
jgi:hypothetical protein